VLDETTVFSILSTMEWQHRPSAMSEPDGCYTEKGSCIEVLTAACSWAMKIERHFRRRHHWQDWARLVSSNDSIIYELDEVMNAF